jgi:hypothetical protein
MTQAIPLALLAASTTAKVVTLTILRTVAAGVKIWIGLATPNNKGPIAMPLPAAVFNKL